MESFGASYHGVLCTQQGMFYFWIGAAGVRSYGPYSSSYTRRLQLRYQDVKEDHDCSKEPQK